MRRFNKFLGIAALAMGMTGTGAFAAPSLLTLNEIYGGGGNTGAAIKNDYVELYNATAAAIDLTGYRVQYASATGAFDAVTVVEPSTLTTVITSGSIQAGGFFLIQESAGTGGTQLSSFATVDFVDPSAINMSGTTGKVRLVDPSGAVIDLVGFGGATTFEGAVAPAPSNTTSVMRIPNGTDTDNNSTDFLAGVPTPGAVNAVPEPTTFGVVGLGLACGLLRRRRGL